MKKIIYSLALIAFLVSIAALSAARAEDSSEDVIKTDATVTSFMPKLNDQDGKKLEKIPAPAQIYLYEKIEKMGTALWGVRKDMVQIKNKIENKIENKLENKIENKIENKMPAHDRLLDGTLDTSKLEKIVSPDQIKMYDKIKKVGTALWGIKKDIGGMVNPKPAIITAENSACVISAIDVKDKALQEKVGVAAESLRAAIGLRSTCQQQAVKSTERQREYLDACVKAFREEHKKINETARKAQNDIWGVYKTSLKSCHPVVATTTSATVSTESVKVEQGVIMIEDGSENITDTVLKINQE